MRWAPAAALRSRRARTSARSPTTQPTPAPGPRLPSSFFLSLTCSLARVPPRKLPRLTNHWSRRLLLRKRFRGSVGLHSTQERCRAANERTIGRVREREREPKPQSDQTWLLKRGAACCAPYRVSCGVLYATVTSELRYTSCMVLSSCTPSFIGRWNALRPEMRPVPPARLLMTAVVTASSKSLAPEAPPLLIKPARPI